jgi:hypothetical protein
MKKSALFSLAFGLFLASSLTSQGVESQDQFLLSTAEPEVGVNRADLQSRFKNILGRGEAKQEKSWWETRKANKERKAYTVAQPVKISEEGVDVEANTVGQPAQVTTSPVNNSTKTTDLQTHTKNQKKSSMPEVFLTLRGGAMKPKLSQWDTFYEDSHMKNYGLELGYHLRWGFSILTRAQTMKTRGKGLLTSTSSLGSDVDYKLYPLQGGLQWEFAFTPRDLVRPFLAGGYAHAIYRQEVSDGRKFKGYVSGTWAKTGLLLDLSQLDEKAIRSGQELFQKVHFVLEVERLWLNSDAVSEDLGGFNFGGGIRIGF